MKVFSNADNSNALINVIDIIIVIMLGILLIAIQDKKKNISENEGKGQTDEIDCIIN